MSIYVGLWVMDAGGNLSNYRYQRDIDNANKIWRQCGIQFTLKGFETLGYTFKNIQTLQSKGAAFESADPRLQYLLLSRPTHPYSRWDIVIYYVGGASFGDSSIGSSPYPVSLSYGGPKPSIILTDDAHPDVDKAGVVLAHELGHTLFLNPLDRTLDNPSPTVDPTDKFHDLDSINNNLMQRNGVRSNPQINPSQCAKARQTVFTTPVQKLSGTHSGNFIKSTYGGQGNFELLIPKNNDLVHYWRNNDEPEHPWYFGEKLTIPPGEVPINVSLIQSNFKGDGVQGNFEAVVRMRSLSNPDGTKDWLAFYFYDSNTRKWSEPSPVIADENQIVGVTGNPALIQSTYGVQGDFQLLVPQGNELAHYFRSNDQLHAPWYKVTVSQPTIPAGTIPINVSLIQSDLKGDGVQGNLEAIVRMRSVFDPEGTKDWLEHYYFDSKTNTWNGTGQVKVDGNPIVGVTGNPTLIQKPPFDQGIDQGEFEILVPQGNELVSYWRHNYAPNGYPWFKSERQPFIPKMEPPVLGIDPINVSLIESNFGDLEAIVRMRSIIDFDGKDDGLSYYYFDHRDSYPWIMPTSLTANGSQIDGITGF
jgi:hypothetical protein